MPHPKAKSSDWLPGASLVALAMISFAPALAGDWVWVDRPEIVEAGYRVTSWDDFHRVWRWSLDDYLFREDGTRTGQGGYWRPLYALGISLSWSAFGEHTVLWHAQNLLWHAAVVWLLYRLGQKLAADSSCTPDSTGTPEEGVTHNRDGWGPAWLAAALFAVHPLGVHSVAWISGLKDLQCACLGTLSVVCFVSLPRTQHPILAAVGCVVSGLLAMGFKELGCCATVFIAASFVYQVGCHGDRTRWGIRALAVSGLLVGLVALLSYRSSVLGAVGLNADYPAEGWIANIATAARLAVHYVGRVFWPWEPNLSDRWRVTEQLDPIDFVCLACAGLGLAGLGLAGRRRSPTFLPLLWYATWMLPATGLLPLRHMRAERYLYPASWGFLLAACLVLDWLCRRWCHTSGQRRLVTCLTGTLVAACCVHTMFTSREWVSDAALFGAAVRRDPNYLEGRVAMAQATLEAQDYAGSAEHARHALQLAEDHTHTGYWSPFIAHSNYGLALYHLGELAAARDQFLAALKRRPQSATTHYHLGLVALGQAEWETARQLLLAADRQHPGDLLTRGNLAFAELQLGHHAEAIKWLRPLVDGANEMQPDDAARILNRRNLAAAYLAERAYAKAAETLEPLVQRNEAEAVDYAKLALCYARLERAAESRRAIEAALLRAPDDPVVRQVQRLISVQ